MRLCIIFIFLIFFPIEVKSTECDHVEISLLWCKENVLCHTKFFLEENNYDRATFEFLYNRIIASYVLHEKVEQWLCLSNATLEFRDLWVLFLSKYRFCEHENQYFDRLSQRCVCKLDKLCTYIDPGDLEFHFADHQLFSWGLFFMIVVTIIFFVKRARQLLLTLDDIRLLLKK